MTVPVVSTARTIGSLFLEDGSRWDGSSFGAVVPTAGEAVFTTGMVGYPESITDPSYNGQILIFSYPMIGNYGVPKMGRWESEKIQASALIVSSYVPGASHHQSLQSLSSWLKKEHVPALEIKDTRALVQKIREQGTMLGKITFGEDIDYFDPNEVNLVERVSIPSPRTYAPLGKHANVKVVLIDCGVKHNIIRSLITRGVEVLRVPWDYDIFSLRTKYDGVVISNGPGDPKMVPETIETTRKLLLKNVPILGICLGNQILALAAGGDTYKMKFGHRSQNQPCKIHDGSGKFYLTTQNHSFAVGKVPDGFVEWFSNANDGTNEGIIHQTKPFMSVQFHPEATPGPTDAGWLFDYFITKISS